MMTKAIKYLSLALFAAFAFSGCARGIAPVTGMLYSDLKAPYDVTNGPNGNKSGTAVCESYLGLIGVGDCSTSTAARSAGITKIHHVDYHTTGILGVYAKVEVTVYGD